MCPPCVTVTYCELAVQRKQAWELVWKGSGEEVSGRLPRVALSIAELSPLTETPGRMGSVLTTARVREDDAREKDIQKSRCARRAKRTAGSASAHARACFLWGFAALLSVFFFFSCSASDGKGAPTKSAGHFLRGAWRSCSLVCRQHSCFNLASSRTAFFCYRVFFFFCIRILYYLYALAAPLYPPGCGKTRHRSFALN